MPETAVLFIHALTGLHPGTGTALGVVDLPVQRERHTQWPTIPASSLKGVLRECCRRKKGADDSELLAVFGLGPRPGSDQEHAGALALTDARLLAFPVRSLSGVFAWVTCPGVLHRLRRDLRLTGLSAEIEAPPGLGPEEAACAADSPLLIDGDHLVLEEFDFTRKGDVSAIADWLALRATDDAETRARIKSHLVVLNDDDFTHFARYATEVAARIGLDYERKTVKAKALFYEEFLPAETLFYALAIAEKSRRKDQELGGRAVLGFVRDHLPPLVQIGGDETIGKGLCAVRLVGANGADR